MILRGVDIPSFLQQYPPFDDVEDDVLAGVVAATHIEFHPAGEAILRQGGEPAHHLYVVRTGAVEMQDGDQVLDLLSEGELFGHPSLLSGMSPTLSVRAHEDTIVYLIDKHIALSILGTQSGLQFLSSSLRRRVVRALEGLNPEAVDPWRTRVGALVRRPPVTAEASLTIREAAELMTTERVSSLLVHGPEGVGIVTDRDLRSRVLALGRSPEAPLEEILTSPVETVDAGTIVADVAALMLEKGVHHVPVLDGEGEVLGVVTNTDLMGLEHKTPYLLKVDIERATTADEVIAAALRLPDAVCTLVEANVDSLHVAHVIGVTTDAATRQLLDLGIAQIGEPPCPWAWLALGSEGRLEQALLRDQDNAMVIDPGSLEMAAVDPYFQRLADFVNDGLQDSGIPKCSAGVIASNPAWRHTPGDWSELFRRWVEEGTWMGGAMSAIAFDYRHVAGPLNVESSFGAIIRWAGAQDAFIRRIAKTALEDRPPTGFGRDEVIHAKGRTAEVLDIKRGGIALITNVARVYALMSGLAENRTLRRLHQAAELGRLNTDMLQGLEEAFGLLWQTRLEHQVQQVRAGVVPDDQVDPSSLGPLGRQGLKEAFRMIDRVQDVLANRVGVGR